MRTALIIVLSLAQAIAAVGCWVMAMTLSATASAMGNATAGYVMMAILLIPAFTTANAVINNIAGLIDGAQKDESAR